MRGHPEICKLMVNACGLVSDSDVMRAAITMLTVNGATLKSRDTAYREMFRLFIEEFGIDLELDEPPSDISKLPIWWYGCPDNNLLDIMLRNQATSDPAQPMFDLFQIESIDLQWPEYMGFQDPEVLLRIFGIPWTPEALACLPIRVKSRLLHIAIIAWSKENQIRVQCSLRFASLGSFERWKRLAWDAVRAGAAPATPLEGHTALTRLLTAGHEEYGQHFKPFRPGGKEQLQESLEEWISGLAEAGVSLCLYAQLEQQAWDDLDFVYTQQKAKGRAEDNRGVDFDRFVIDGLKTGHHPHDWHLIFRNIRVLAIWKHSAAPGAWLEHSYSHLDIVQPFRGRWWPKEEPPAPGYREAKLVLFVSAPLEAQPVSHRAGTKNAPNCQVTAGTQDDAGPTALAALWRRRSTPRFKRSTSQP